MIICLLNGIKQRQLLCLVFPKVDDHAPLCSGVTGIMGVAEDWGSFG